jgi:hypothetical protein
MRLINPLSTSWLTSDSISFEETDQVCLLTQFYLKISEEKNLKRSESEVKEKNLFCSCASLVPLSGPNLTLLLHSVSFSIGVCCRRMLLCCETAAPV